MNITNIIKAIVKNGGYTVNQHGETPKSGYIVARRGYEKIIPANIRLSKLSQEISRYMDENLLTVYGSAVAYYGFWLDKGKLYMDIVDVIVEPDTAQAIAELNDQLSYYHIDTSKVIWTVKDEALAE